MATGRQLYRLEQLRFREDVAWKAFYKALDGTDYATIYRLMLGWLDLSNRREALEGRLGIVPPARERMWR